MGLSSLLTARLSRWAPAAEPAGVVPFQSMVASFPGRLSWVWSSHFLRLRRGVSHRPFLPGSGHARFHVPFRALSPRGGPIRAGWNRTAAASVQTSARAISLPMLDRPGCLESQRLPNAVTVVSAL